MTVNTEEEDLSQESQRGAGVGTGPEGSARVLLLSYHSLLRILPPPGSVRQNGFASASHLAQAALEKALFTV